MKVADSIKVDFPDPFAPTTRRSSFPAPARLLFEDTKNRLGMQTVTMAAWIAERTSSVSENMVVLVGLGGRGCARCFGVFLFEF